MSTNDISTKDLRAELEAREKAHFLQQKKEAEKRIGIGAVDSSTLSSSSSSSSSSLLLTSTEGGKNHETDSNNTSQSSTTAESLRHQYAKPSYAAVLSQFDDRDDEVF